MEQGTQRRIDKSTIYPNRGSINNVSNNIDSSTAVSIQDSRPNMTADSQPNNNVDNSQVNTVLDNKQPSVSLNNTGGSQVQDSVIHQYSLVALAELGNHQIGTVSG